MSVTGLKSHRKRGGALAAMCGYVLIAIFVITPALGREISDAERVALKTALSEYTAAILEGNVPWQISVAFPPRLAGLLAKKTRKTVEALQERMIATGKKRRQEAPLESFAFDFKHATFGALPSGEPYAFIPATIVAVTGDPPKTLTREKTLALIENGKWYLVSVSQPHTAAWFREAYPEFAQVSLPEGTTENLEK
jgi:hypothetical protein